MKSKYFAYSILTFSLILIGALIYFLSGIIQCSRYPVSGQDSKYFFLFKSEKRHDLTSIHSFQNSESSQFAYRYRQEFNIIILQDDKFNQSNIDKIKIVNDAVINIPNPSILTEYSKFQVNEICTPEINYFKIKLEEQSKILNTERGTKFFSFQLELSKISISNEFDKDFLIFSSTENKIDCNFIIYNQDDKTYVIIVYPLNQNIRYEHSPKELLNIE